MVRARAMARWGRPVLLLAGLGVQELSMSPPAIANVKTALHKQTMEYWSELAQELLKAETASDMQAVLNSLTGCPGQRNVVR